MAPGRQAVVPRSPSRQGWSANLFLAGVGYRTLSSSVVTLPQSCYTKLFLTGWQHNNRKRRTTLQCLGCAGKSLAGLAATIPFNSLARRNVLSRCIDGKCRNPTAFIYPEIINLQYQKIEKFMKKFFTAVFLF